MLIETGWLKSERGTKSQVAGNHFLIRTAASSELGSTDGQPDPESSTSDPESSGEDDSSTSNAWIAGAVIGPLAAVALIGFAVWFIRRRKNNAQVELPPQEMSGEAYRAPYKAEKVAEGPTMLHELGGTKAPAGGTFTHQELPANVEVVHELPGSTK